MLHIPRILDSIKQPGNVGYSVNTRASVLGGIAHGDDQVAVELDRVVLVIVFVLVLAVAGDLHDDVHGVHPSSPYI
jgi:hypothetical protein